MAFGKIDSVGRVKGFVWVVHNSRHEMNILVLKNSSNYSSFMVCRLNSIEPIVNFAIYPFLINSLGLDVKVISLGGIEKLLFVNDRFNINYSFRYVTWN